MSNKKVTEAQVLGTRDCNLRCGYCEIVKNPPFDLSEELNLEDWKIAFKKLDEFGIKTVKGLGGEWTVKNYLTNLVDFITDETDIKFTLLSNSLFDKKTQEQLVEAGLEGYFASVDYYSDKLKTEDLTGKSSPGLKMLFELKDSGVETLGANTVIMPQNMETIPELLEFLTENGIVMNICPVHGGGNHSFEYRAKDISGNINEKYRLPFEKLIDTLFDMKDDGYFLATPSSYLEAIKSHVIPLDWKCNEFSQLRIDANGDIKVCPDGGFLHYIDDHTETAKKYNIMQLTQEDYNNLDRSWELNSWRKNCPGCGPWSAQYRAEKNKQYGIGDPALNGRKNR